MFDDVKLEGIEGEQPDMQEESSQLSGEEKTME